jgi:hypothetical protein
LFQIRVTASIILHLLRVRVAIDFNNQSGFLAKEVNHIRPDHVLPAEAQAAHLIPAQMQPQFLLRRRHLAAHLAGPVVKNVAKLVGLATTIWVHRVSPLPSPLPGTGRGS